MLQTRRRASPRTASEICGRRKKPTRTKPTLGWVSPRGGESEETREYYRKILNSNRLRAEERREIEFVEKLQVNAETLIEHARRVAAQQARKTYRCEACGLELLGVLAFAEHDEQTSHMTELGKKVQFGGEV